MDVNIVILSHKVKKDLKKIPNYIAIKLMTWVSFISKLGLREVRKSSGFHDEPIRSKERKGQRSIRLSKGYRAFYIVKDNGTIEFVEILEVNKHEY